MSFLSKALSKVGIGAAKVDAVLDNSSVAPGEPLTGVINITGGKVEQEINKLDLDVYCNYFVELENDEGETEISERTCCINSWDINEAFTIGAGEEKQLTFELILSPEAPISVGRSATWLKTNLDIDFALDKSDKDYINVVPNELQQAVLEAIESLGFSLDEAECEGYDSARGSLPFVQEFEFKPRGGDFRGRLEELEMVMFSHSSDEITLALEIDRKARGISGFFAKAFGMDETKTKVVVNHDNIDDFQDTLYDLVDDNC